MEREDIWITFMAAALSSKWHGDLRMVTECAAVADLALAEYEKRIVGRGPNNDPHFEPRYE